MTFFDKLLQNVRTSGLDTVRSPHAEFFENLPLFLQCLFPFARFFGIKAHFLHLFTDSLGIVFAGPAALHEIGESSLQPALNSSEQLSGVVVELHTVGCRELFHFEFFHNQYFSRLMKIPAYFR